MANLVVEAVPPDVTGVASAINAIMRTIGGAIGAQVAAAIVSASLSDGARYPAESGFTGAFAMSAAASAVALLVCFAIPSRERRARAQAGAGGDGGGVSEDDRLSPEIIRRGDRRDRRDGHVDPRHDDRQRRASSRCRATSTRRCRRSSGWPAATCSRWPA